MTTDGDCDDRTYSSKIIEDTVKGEASDSARQGDPVAPVVPDLADKAKIDAMIDDWFE